MKARPVTAGGAEVSGKEWDGKRKEQAKAETEGRVKKRSHNDPVGEEKRASPSRGGRGLRQRDDSLRCEQAEEGCEAFWDREQLDGDLTNSWGSCIASQPLVPRKAIMRPLRTGENSRRCWWPGLRNDRFLYVQLLVAQQLDASLPMLPAWPVTPEHWVRAALARMQQHTHEGSGCWA